MVEEEIKLHKKYRTLEDSVNKVWNRISFWTHASDVEFNDGQTAQEKLGSIKGITTSTDVIETGYATDATITSELNNALVAENGEMFKFGYDSTTRKYGYWKKEADTDVFVPFKSSYVYHNTYTLTSHPSLPTPNCITQFLDIKDTIGLECTKVIISVWSLKTSTKKIVYLYNGDLISDPNNINVVSTSGGEVVGELSTYIGVNPGSRISDVPGFYIKWAVPELVTTQSSITESKPVGIDVTLVFNKVN